jgi:hypothetical protein
MFFYRHHFLLFVSECGNLSSFLFCLDLQQKAVEAAMSDVNGSFGKGIVTRLGSAGGALV